MGGQSCSFLLVQNYLLLSFLSIKVFWKLFHSKQPVFVKYLFTAILSACFGSAYFLRIHQIELWYKNDSTYCFQAAGVVYGDFELEHIIIEGNTMVYLWPCQNYMMKVSAKIVLQKASS